MHTAQLLVPELSFFEIEIVIEKLKRYESPCADQIPAQLIQAGSNTLSTDIHKLINSTWYKEELPQQRKVFIIAPIYNKRDKTECSNFRGYRCYQLHINVSQIFLSQCQLHKQKKLLGIISVDFDVIDQLLIKY
jgi:hypothetical protein